MKNIRNLPQRPIPKLIPEYLVDQHFRCPICGSESAVPWLEKMEFPKFPIARDDGQGYWVPVDFPVTCTQQQCNHTFLSKVPILPIESVWQLYGDEAGRYIHSPPQKHSMQPLNFFCITLVGLHRKSHDRVRRKIFKLKQSIRPGVDPDSWSHHFTKIWGSNASNGDYSLKDKAAKIAYAKEFSKVIREAKPDLVTINVSDCIFVPTDEKQRKKQIKLQKEEIFSQSIVATLEIFRKNNKGVRWIFDNIQDTTERNKVEGWAAECFLGLQYSRLFTWLSAGASIEAPKFVPPGSHFLLEIADFISYCVSRDFEKTVLGEKAEFPSSLLGKGLFHYTRGDGDVEQIWEYGFPLKKFYGL